MRRRVRKKMRVARIMVKISVEVVMRRATTREITFFFSLYRRRSTNYRKLKSAVREFEVISEKYYSVSTMRVNGSSRNASPGRLIA